MNESNKTKTKKKSGTNTNNHIGKLLKKKRQVKKTELDKGVGIKTLARLDLYWTL